MSLVFSASILVIIYIYIGYSIILRITNYVVKRNRERIDKSNIISELPLVSIIVTVHNEEDNIVNRINNLLNQSYPRDKLEIIIASDGSTDNTVKFARNININSLRILDNGQRRGKTSTINYAVKRAKGDILIFTDAATSFDRMFVSAIVNKFRDPVYGCVSGRLIYRERGNLISKYENIYWRMETIIRKYENKLGIFSTATGACMAIKGTCYIEIMPEEDIDDSAPLYVINQGYKVAFADDAIAYDEANSSLREKYMSHIRMTSKGILAIIRHFNMTSLFKYPLIWFGITSHKVIRWLSPLFLISLISSSFYLHSNGAVYSMVLRMQLIFYILSLIGLLSEYFRIKIPIIRVFTLFVITNFAIGIGLVKGILGRAPASWE